MRAMGAKYLSILFGCTCVLACSPYSYRVTVVNRADKDIKSVSVAVRDLATEVGPLAPNQKTTMTFTNGGEDGYHVIVNFADGKRLEGEVGYVTVHINSTDTIELYGDKIKIDD